MRNITSTNWSHGPGAELQRSLTSVGRFAEPREVEKAVIFLASQAASMIMDAVLAEKVLARSLFERFCFVLRTI